MNSEHTSNSAIDPEDVIAWLVMQPNANGTLYLENVVRQYMGVLRAAPAKLQIPVVFDVRSVFTCHTPDELNAYWDIFRAAPNYKQVNGGTSGMFSAGAATKTAGAASTGSYTGIYGREFGNSGIGVKP